MKKNKNKNMYIIYMYYVYFEKYNIIIITFSRCWSKTLINWVCALNNVVCRTHDEFISNTIVCLNTVKNIDDYLKKSEIYIISRNPYDRLVSTTLSHHCHDDKTFLEFVRTNKDWNFKCIQPDIEAIMEKYNYTILYFENLKNDFQNICLKHKIETLPQGNLEFKYSNISNFKFTEEIYNVKMGDFTDRLPYYTYFYNQEIINKIYNIFKNDFEKLKIPINIGNLYPEIL